MFSPMPELSVSVQTRGGGWTKLGTGHRFQVIPESISISGDLDEYGCSEATFLLRMNPRFPHQELEMYTPVVFQDGNDDVWSGRVIATPTSYADEAVVHVQCQGWGQHTKDDCADKLFVVNDLTQFVPTIGLPNVVLSGYFMSGRLEAGSSGIVIGLSNNDYCKANRAFGCSTYDAGPNNLIAYALMDYASQLVWSANFYMDMMVHDTPDPIADITAGRATTIYSLNSFNTVSNAGGAPATARRYLSIFAYFNGVDAAYGFENTVKISNVRIGTSSAYYAANTSAFVASTAVTWALDNLCPLISTDRSRITTTTFPIPHFPADRARRYANEIIDQSNAYQGYQFLLTADATPVPVYRAVPSDYTWAIGAGDDYAFEEPASNDGRPVFSRVISEFADASGVPTEAIASYVVSGAAIGGTTDIVFTNPSFDVNTTGWSISGGGTFNRDTGTFDTTPASASWSVITAGDVLTGAMTGTALPGKTYRLRFRAYNPAGPGFDYIARVRFGGTTDYAEQTFISNVLGWTTYEIVWAPKSSVATPSFKMIPQFTTAFFFRVDSFEVGIDVSNPVSARGFTKTATKPMEAPTTAAAALNVAQLELNAAQFPPLKGTIAVTGRIRKKGGDTEHVSRIPMNVGDAILIENLADPNTGALGRQGIVRRATYDRQTDVCTIEVDDPTDFIDAIRHRLAG